MCGAATKVGVGLGAFTKAGDPLNVFGTQNPDIPRVKKPPTLDPAEAERKAREAERIRRLRARGGFGFSDTRKSGSLGLSEQGNAPQKTLLGG